MSTFPNPSFRSQRIKMTRNVNRYYIWHTSPDWIQGVVILSKPARSASVVVDGSIIPLEATETKEYFDIVPTADRANEYNFTIDSPFDHLRIRETGASGSEFWVYSTGLIVEADPITGTPR